MKITTPWHFLKVVWGKVVHKVAINHLQMGNIISIHQLLDYH